MRKLFIVVLSFGFLFLIAGILVFHYAMGLDWLNACYFALTIVTTIGFGDISLLDAGPGVKAFGMLLMLVGTACVAALFGIITDYLLSARMDEFFGSRRKKMNNHIVVCGLGTIGFRITEWLHKTGEKIIVVAKTENSKFVTAVRDMKIPVVFGDIALQETLKKVHIESARCLIAATDQDLANIEAGLNARIFNEDIRVVLRIFDHNLANKLQSGMDIDMALSTSALSAPAFAMAAVDPSVVGSFFIGDDLMLNIEIVVAENSALHGMTSEELADKGDFAVLVHQCARTGKRLLIPSEPVALAPGDRIVVAAPHQSAPRLHELNR